MNEDKFLRSQERKARARAESLQHLVLLLSPPESAPESQAERIADTPEAEPEPAEAHELTGEGTTDATDPTTSDGGSEGDGNIDYDELEAIYHVALMCWDDRREGIFPSAAPEHHPVLSPPAATSDEPGTGTGMVPDATMMSQLEAMLDEPEADTGAAPDASPATELQLLQSPDPEQTTLMRDTPLAEQAEHSPRVESSPPSDTSPPGPPEPSYSSSETPPLPDPEYSSSSLSEEANDRDNIAKVGAPTDADDTTVEADNTKMTVTEPDCGASPMKTE